MQSPKEEKSCPTCENSLEDHTHEQMIQCLSKELAKIDKKTGPWVFD